MGDTGDYVADVAPLAASAGGEDPDGNHITFTTGDDTPWVYFFTGSTGTGDGAMLKSGGLPLTSPLTIHGDAAKTFVMDFREQVVELNAVSSDGIKPE